MINRSKKAVIIKVTAIILIIAIIFIPYEASFIRFNSAEASVRYSTVNYRAPIRTVETDKTAFCVGHESTTFYYNTVTKYNDKYGFCHPHTHNALNYINTIIDDENFKGGYTVSKLVNNETNEKCYIIELSRFYPTGEDICIYDEQNNPIGKITFPDKRTLFAIVVNEADEKASFIFNGKTYELN